MSWIKNAHIRSFVYALNNKSITFYSNDVNTSVTLVKRFFKCMHFGVPIPKHNYPRVIDAVNVNNLPLVQWLYAQAAFQYTHGYYIVIDSAAELGYLDIIKWLHTQTTLHMYFGINNAARNGHWETVRWLLTHYPKKESNNVMKYTAKAGNLEMLKWLHGCVPNIKLGDAINYAAENGHWECMKWLFDAYPKEKTGQNSHSCLISHAAKFGAIDIIEWLRANVQNLAINNAVDIAALNCQWETARWLLTNYPNYQQSSSMVYSAKAGNLDYIKWVLTESKETYSPHVMNSAAAGGHLHILQWLHTHRKGCDPDAILYAVNGGHLHCVKWLFANYLTECTFEFVNAAIVNASQRGYTEIVVYLLEHRVEQCVLTAIKNAQVGGFIEMERYLRGRLHPDLHMK